MLVGSPVVPSGTASDPAEPVGLRRVVSRLFVRFTGGWLGSDELASSTRLDTMLSPLEGGSIRSHLLHLGSGRVEYSTAGHAKAPALLFVHELGVDMRQFLPQLDLARRGYRVILVSLRGHGSSTAPGAASAHDFRLSLLVRDVLGLLDRLEIPSVNLVGCGLGGLVGWELARQRPERLASLATIGTVLHRNTTSWQLLLHRAAYSRVLHATRNAPLVLPHLSSHQPKVRARLRHMSYGCEASHVAWLHEQMLRFDYREIAAQIACPVLVLEPEYHRPEPAWNETARVLHPAPRRRHVRLSAAGRFANMERPASFNEELHGFLVELGLHRRISRA